jgi:hypothetical protein
MQDTPGQVEISLEFKRHVGPRYIHGAVQISFDSLQPYSFSSEAVWPQGAAHDLIVQEAVEEVLLQRNGTLDRVRVVLRSVNRDPTNPSAEGFRRATLAATEAAFSV